MTADDWKLIAILLGIPAVALGAWAVFLMILTPLFKEWMRKIFKSEFDRWEEAHRVALAARDTGVAYMESAKLQGEALTAAINALAAAHNTAISFGELRQAVNEFKAEVEAKFEEQDTALDAIGKTLADIRGFMRGAGMDRRTSDHVNDDRP